MATPTPVAPTSYTTSGGSIVNPAGFSPGVLSPGFTNNAGQKGNPAVGTNVAIPATQSTQGNNPINQTIAQNYGSATLPPLAPTTTGSSTAQTNTMNPPVVANSNAAQTDLNTINTNANAIGNSVTQQQQAQQANTNAQTQAQQQATQQATSKQPPATDPSQEPITAKDLSDAMSSLSTSQGSTASGVNTGQDVGQVTTTTDANGNQIQNVTPPTEDNSDLNSELNTIQQNAQQTLDPLQAQLAQQQSQLIDISNQQIQAAQNTQNQIQGLLNGTLPLSQVDQAQLAGVQAQYNDLISTAQGAAQAYTAGVTAAGMATGRAMYTPELNLSLINQATQAGISKVQTLTAEGAAAYAKLQSDLQNSDLTAIQDSYKAMSDALTARSTAVQSMVKDTQDAITQAYTQQQDDINDAFKSATLTQTEKQNIFNDAMENSKFTETQKQDIETNYLKGQQLSLDAEKVQQGQEDIAIKLQTLKDNEDNASLAAANALQTTPSGNKYVDGTGLDAAGQAKALQSGIPVLTGDNAKAMSSVNSGQQAFSGFMTSLQNSGLVNSQGQFITGYRGLFGGTQQSGTTFSSYLSNADSTGATKQAFDNFTQSLTGSGTSTKASGIVSQLRALGDAKLTGSIISDIDQNVPQASDTLSTVATKMGNLQNALQSAENAILSASTAVGTVTSGGKTYSVDSLGNLTPIQ